MKKQVQFTATTVVISLPQVSYTNKHGLLLCKKQEACPDCGKITIKYVIEDPTSDIYLMLNENEYEELEGRGFDEWSLNTIFENYEWGQRAIFRGDLRFRMEDLESENGYEGVAFVTYVGGKDVYELHLNEDRFKSIQDILNYSVDDFAKDLISGEFHYDLIK